MIAHLYKVTNNVTGSYYVGKHNGFEQNGYWGSGFAIKGNIAKYGKENFKYEILCYGTPEYILELESRYVTLDLIESDTKCLNLSAGGLGGKKITEETKKKLGLLNSGKNNPMYGKNHTEKTKQKIVDALTGKLVKVETRNILSKITSEKLWVNNGVINKRIKKQQLEKYIGNGFERGRTEFSSELKQKISQGISKLIWVNNNQHNLRVKIEMLNTYLQQGYFRGRGKINFKDKSNG
jgi:group I intron endonuclease